MIFPAAGLGSGLRVICAVATLAVHVVVFGLMTLLPGANAPPQPEATVQLALVSERESEQAETIEASVSADEKSDPVNSEQVDASESQPVQETDTVSGAQPSQDTQASTDVSPPEAQVAEAPSPPEPDAALPDYAPAKEAPIAAAITPPPAPKIAQKKPVPKITRQPTPSRQAVAGKNQDGGKSAGGTVNAARYRAIVQAGLAGRKNVLGGRGFSGTVAIRFTIGSSGGVIAASVVRSSGDHSLDSAARSLVASASFPPPPGGQFSAVVPFQVN